ncbi:STAS domain-containing protein [Actinoplanes sp. NPDC049596]|uniref:STAS domain-containing protein n=1 Tax=unclassified Actinoplanes TaxID=2626549 RepID=UPI003449F885
MVRIFGLEGQGIRVVGAVPVGVPSPSLPDLASLPSLVLPPAGLVLVGYSDNPQARTVPGLVVYRYDSPLFFANADNFRRRALAAVTAHEGPVAWFVLNAEANVEVDITALDAVERLRHDLVERGIVFALARVKQDLLVDLESYGLADAVGADRIFPTLPTAVAAYEKWRTGSGRA